MTRWIFRRRFQVHEAAVVSEEQRDRAGIPVHEVDRVRPVRLTAFYAQAVCADGVKIRLRFAAARELRADVTIKGVGG